MSTAAPVSHLYQEVWVDLEAPAPGATIAIPLPSTAFLSRSNNKRRIQDDSYIDTDETSFARRHLATDGSIFFRTHHQYPRSFLWGLLDDRKILELRAVDLYKSTGKHVSRQKEEASFEANHKLLLGFPAPIKPFCVALAEPEDRDAVTIFAITTSNELYTITLNAAFFSKLQASEQNPPEWCKIWSAASFSFRYPYRLISASANEVWISLHDGGIMRLKRAPGDDGSNWSETTFAEGGWGSFRTLMPWKGQTTVKFGGVDIASTAAAAIGLSPNGGHIFTVCLNHTLRAWSSDTGKAGIQGDLLGEDLKEIQKGGQYLISPSQSHLMQVVEVPAPADGDEYYVVTYSPKRHQFKFWGVRDPDLAELGIHDARSDFEFVPPVDELMNTTVWNLEEFHVNASKGWGHTELWIRTRSGPNSKVYTINFDLFADGKELEKAWRREWAVIEPSPPSVAALKLDHSNPLSHDQTFDNVNFNTSERWLEFIFYPGRFAAPALETALCIYKTGLGRDIVQKSASKIPLKQRVVTAINSVVQYKKRDDKTMDHVQHEADLGAQWQTFYGLIQDLQKRRGESIGLAFDDREHAPWLVLSGYVAPVRKRSQYEVLASNPEALETRIDIPRCLRDSIEDRLVSPDISKLLHAAKTFRKRLSPSFQDLLSSAVSKEMFQQHWTSVQVRLEAFEAICEFEVYISEDDGSQLEDSLGFLARSRDGLFDKLLDLFSEESHGHRHDKSITKTGMEALLRISQEVVDEQIQALLDLLVVVVYLAFYPEPELLPKSFDSSFMFTEILELLKQHYLLKWMHTATITSTPPIDASTASGSSSQKGVETTLMELMTGMDAFNVKVTHEDLPRFLTQWARTWTFAPFHTNTDMDMIAEDIMANLLRHKEWSLAEDFRKFLGPSVWSLYLLGRLHLARGEFNLAAKNFRLASSSLSNSRTSLNSIDRTEFVGMTDRDLFCAGIPRYCSHIMRLFEQAKAYSFVIDFSRLALRDHSMLVTAPKESLRTEILSRLFTACLHTSQFSDAYSTLIRQPDLRLRKANLTSLIGAMTSQNQTSALLHLPLASLATEVDDILESLSHKTLNITSGPPYHKILYAFRVSRNDFRGAASILYERLQRLQASSNAGQEALTQSYLILINTLASVTPEQAWIFAEARVEEDSIFGGGTARIGRFKEVSKRRVVTLADIRREYQQELDRQSALENGQFAFGADTSDVMDFS